MPEGVHLRKITEMLHMKKDINFPDFIFYISFVDGKVIVPLLLSLAQHKNDGLCFSSLHHSLPREPF